MEAFITFGLKNGKLEHISNVDNGLECNCFCPYCKSPLIAKANKKGIKYKRTSHFSHINEVDCPNAYETALHLLAKEVFIESKTLQLPDFHFDYNSKNSYSKYAELEIIKFDSAKGETVIITEKGIIIADILAEKNQKKVIIEFAKSHFVDNEKKQKIEHKNIPTIEINLKGQELNRESLKTLFLNKSPNIYWIFNKKLEDNYKNHLEFKIKLNLDSQQREYEKLINQELYLEEKRKQNYLIFDITQEYIYNCPIAQEKKNEFINTPYFEIPLLRKIYKGLPWDKVIYGSIHSRFYIKIDNDNIYLKNSESDEDHKEFANLYRGLKKIQEFEKISCFEHCRKCRYHKEEVKAGNNDYLVCGYRST